MLLLIKTTLSVLLLLAFLTQAGCKRIPPPPSGKSKEAGSTKSASSDRQQIVETIRAIVAEQLSLTVSEVDVDAPLFKQKKAADDLDLVEIIMNVENAFNIEIKDEEVGVSLEEIGGNLSVNKLADIVSSKKPVK